MHLSKWNKAKTSTGPRRGYGTETVTLVSEVDGDRFTFHKSILCGRSKYFKAAFLGGFREAEEGSTNVEASAKQLESFQKWVYEDFVSPPHDASTELELIELYAMVDQYDTPILRHRITDALAAFPFGARSFDDLRECENSFLQVRPRARTVPALHRFGLL